MSTKIETRVTSVPQHRLRRLALRAIRILERHEPNEPVLASVAPTMRTIANEYIGLYDELVTGKQVRARALREGRAAIRALAQSVRMWIGWLARDIDEFDSSVYRGDVTVPDDVLTDAAQLIEVVTRYQAQHDPGLDYAEELVAELGAKLEAASKEWGEAQDAIVVRQEAQARLREMSGDLQQSLIALRRTLRATFGTRHADYQKLRLSRSAQVDVEDPEVLEGKAKPGDPVAGLMDSPEAADPEETEAA